MKVETMIRAGLLLLFTGIFSYAVELNVTREPVRSDPMKFNKENTIRLFLSGDVMTGRGIDQILPHPGDPELHESYVKSAKGYVILAERENGKIPYPVDPAYIWGDAMSFWRELSPDLRIINLETSITTHHAYWPGKAVNYRMHPDNSGCLTSAGIDYCALANNHLLDYGREGMLQTLQVLQEAGISFSGAGGDLEAARKPAILSIPRKGRVFLFSVGFISSGTPIAWAASGEAAGIYIPITDQEILDFLKAYLKVYRRDRDLVVVSIHWGSNWGYEIPAEHRRLAHRLIDEAGVDVIHGHSSHHFKGIEVYHDRPIIYGAGDFINDYEGISGYEAYRGDLTLMYFLDLNPAEGGLEKLTLIPVKIRNMQLEKAVPGDIKWVHSVLEREGRTLNTGFVIEGQGRIEMIYH
jgi:poly-gamma-glutamate capsule biosynthesis protein CapA/YwtB (metallophosphatase superfamily)